MLASLRGGLGESYRLSVAAILSDHPAGLTFRELLAVVRDRQAHAVHRGTLRVVLHAGGFVRQDGRWQVAPDDSRSRRLLREAVVRAAGGTAAGESEPTTTRARLLDVATSVAGRCRAILSELRRAPGS
ncbi:MAG: hypothetical protein JO355_09200 [Planctomycetaceae bacterium]|nr:hypothetical protein [Planctomycetaceae bacterium]